MAVKPIQRLWEDLVIKQAEKIPFRAGFGLEVPEDPSVGLLLKDGNLGSNVVLRVRFELLVPRLDEVPIVAGANPRAAGVVSSVPCSHVPTVESRGTVGHCSRPLGDDGPMVDILSIGGRVRTDIFDMFLARVSAQNMSGAWRLLTAVVIFNKSSRKTWYS